MKHFVILLASGTFLAPNGDEIFAASEALTFRYCHDAVKHSFKYLGSRTVEVCERTYENYAASELRQEPLFEDHVYACLSDTDLLNLLTSKVAN